MGLEEKYTSHYSQIEIESIDIFPQSSLPKNFSEMEFVSLHVSSSYLRKSSGSFKASFVYGKGKKKNIYFRYAIKAQIPVFKAKYKLSNGKILTSNDYEQEIVSFDTLPLKLLESIEKDTFVARQNIKKGTILTQRHFKRRLLIPKNSYVLALLRDGALILQFEVKAVSGGNKGDTIRVKSKEGKLFDAIILNKDKVVIK